MGRLIDADKLNKKKKYLFRTENGAFPKSEWFIKADDFFAAPTVDAKEVVHAKWEWYDAWEGDDTFGEWKMLRCSHCLESEGARENAKYCSNCGAIMDLE